MKIKTFSKINNASSYSFFDWDSINRPTFVDRDGSIKPRDTSFAKSNIIFAENGNGKSKLVDILKSLDSNSTSIDKHRDRQGDNQEIKISIDDGSDVEFATSWSNENFKGKFLFFDKQYIDSHVHSAGPDHADTAQRKQQRGRDIVYLGDFAEYNNEIEKVDRVRDLVREKNESLKERKTLKIAALLDSLGLTTEDLLAQRTAIESLKPTDLQHRNESLIAAESDLAKALAALKDKAKISSLKSLREVPDSFSLRVSRNNGTDTILDPVELLSFTAARGVQATLHKIEHKKEFIKRGLTLITDDSAECPFCEQPIRPDKFLQIIQDYQDIFDETFSQEETNTRDLLLKYKNILENLKEVQVPQTNQDALDELKTFETVTIVLPPLSVTDEEKAILKAEMELVVTKEASVLEKVDGSNSAEIKRIVSEVNSKISTYNEGVIKINGQIARLKSDASEGKLEVRKSALEEEIKKLKADAFFLEKRAALENYFGAIDRYQQNLKTIGGLDRIHKALKEKIVEEFKTFVTDYFRLIADFVKRISPSMDFQIRGQPTYDERSPRDPAQCGFRVEYDKHDYTASLSEGERQVIALAFFFARLSKEDKDKIVILDDPITSFDTGKRKSTAEVIKKETEDYAQLFVLTCDPLFRQYCLKQIPNRKFYYILKTAGSSAIHFADSKRETIYSCFEEEFRDIETVLGTNENVVVYGQKLRFCLETKIREEYFGYSEDSLSNMIEKVTGPGWARFENLFNNRDAILEIYSYCNTGGLAHYPKDGATSWNELKDKIHQYLALGL